jgi:ribonuclease HII
LRARLDRELWRSNSLFCGVDEAGRGALAGPVVAGAVIMPAGSDIPGVDDSKKLTPRARQRLAGIIRGQALAWSVGSVGPRTIDRVNILNAALAAMARAIRRLSPRPELALVDGPHAPAIDVPCRPVVGGDRLSFSIACASILAKVHRDGLMVRLGQRYPGYGFGQHKGYPTTAHRRALRELGPSSVHRLSFAPVRECPA